MRLTKAGFLGAALAATVLGGTILFTSGTAEAEKPAEGEVTLIHMGDIHGHLIPRPNLRSDGTGSTEGGLARMYTLIRQIEAENRNAVLVNTGDTLQGGAEALYTRGEAMVRVLNKFGIDIYAAGNWDYVYGLERFEEFFAGKNPKADWGGIGANVYYDGEVFPDKAGQTVLPPYRLREVNGVKVGFLGFSSERGPMVVGPDVVKGMIFTNGEEEYAHWVEVLRDQVDVLVVASELGLAGNIRLAERYPGVDVILSADMHEATPEPVRTSSGTLIVEAGQDGTRLGELTLSVREGTIRDVRFTLHRIDDSIPEHPAIRALVDNVRRPFVTDGTFHAHRHENPFSGTVLKRPIDTVVGETAVGLHRSHFSHEAHPGVLEGTSHLFLAEAFRDQAKAELGVIRGFRYGTHVVPGPITLEDLYHYMPIGPFIARGELTGTQIKTVLENSAHGSLSADPAQWTGGWLFNWAGLRYELDPHAAKGERTHNVEVQNADGDWVPLDLQALYTVASYNYRTEPGLINKIPARNVQRVTDENGEAIEGTEVVANYLKTHVANPVLGNVRLLKPLAAPRYGNFEVQPLGDPNL